MTTLDFFDHNDYAHVQSYKFVKGDLIEYDGIHAEVITNEGIGGDVKLLDGSDVIERWDWSYDGIYVTRVQI